MAIRIFIIDAHPAAREMLAPNRDWGLARRLSSLPDMDILGTAGDGGDGLHQIKELRPDLVLVDIKMLKRPLRDITIAPNKITGG